MFLLNESLLLPESQTWTDSSRLTAQNCILGKLVEHLEYGNLKFPITASVDKQVLTSALLCGLKADRIKQES